MYTICMDIVIMHEFHKNNQRYPIVASAYKEMCSSCLTKISFCQKNGVILLLQQALQMLWITRGRYLYKVKYICQLQVLEMAYYANLTGLEVSWKWKKNIKCTVLTNTIINTVASSQQYTRLPRVST